MSDPLVLARGVTMHFPVSRPGLGGGRAILRALDGVDLDIARGETLGLVGESGSGKSTLGRCLLRLHDPTSGRITFDGADVTSIGGEPLRRLRRRMQIIFQDPYASLNPRMAVEEIIAEPLRIHRVVPPGAIRGRVRELMEEVGLDPRFVRRYPHEFSGGQRQRIGIARAIATEPEFIVADEPISALDISIQAQILNLMSDLKERHRLTTLFISHDLSAIRHVSDRLAVLYLGRVVEMGPARIVDAAPRHPYTAALLSASLEPDPDRARRKAIPLAGEPPSPIAPPPGCPFHPRCPLADERCRREAPALRAIGANRSAACHYAETVPERLGALTTGTIRHAPAN